MVGQCGCMLSEDLLLSCCLLNHGPVLFVTLTVCEVQLNPRSDGLLGGK